MRRDMDLLRQLLLKLEAYPKAPGELILIGGHVAELQVDGYSAQEITYHLSLIAEANLIVCRAGPIVGGFRFDRLTSEGHDFADAVRDDQIWERTRRGASAAGGFTLDLLKALAKGFVRKQVEERTGISLM